MRSIARANGLVVELDGFANHSSVQAFQRDRTKSNQLLTAGCDVLRFTHDDIVRRPAWVAGLARERLAVTPERARPPRARG